MANGDGGRERDAGGEHAAGEVAVGRRKIIRRIVGIGPIPVDHCGLVVRDVDFGRRGRLDHDVLLLVLGLDRDRLLLGGLQLAVVPGTGPQPLDRVHDIGLLRQHGVAELLRPIELLRHHRQHGRNLDQRFQAVVPALLGERAGERIALEGLVGLGPAVRLHDLERIGRGDQYLGQQRIRMERDRRDQLVELRRLEQRLRRRGGRLRRLGHRAERNRAEQRNQDQSQ